MGQVKPKLTMTMQTATHARSDLLKSLDQEVYDDLLDRAIDIKELGYSDLDLNAIMIKLHIKDLRNGSIPTKN